MRAMRLALDEAVFRNDASVIETFMARNLPFDTILRSESGLLSEAMRLGANNVVREIVNNRLEVGESPVIYVNDIEPELILKLVDFGTTFDIRCRSRDCRRWAF